MATWHSEKRFAKDVRNEGKKGGWLDFLDIDEFVEDVACPVLILQALEIAFPLV